MRIYIATHVFENRSVYCGVVTPIQGRESTKPKSFEGVVNDRSIRLLQYALAEHTLNLLLTLTCIKTLIIPVYVDIKMKKLMNRQLPLWVEESLPDKDKLREIRRLNTLLCPEWLLISKVSRNPYYLECRLRLMQY